MLTCLISKTVQSSVFETIRISLVLRPREDPGFFSEFDEIVAILTLNTVFYKAHGWCYVIQNRPY